MTLGPGLHSINFISRSFLVVVIGILALFTTSSKGSCISAAISVISTFGLNVAVKISENWMIQGSSSFLKKFCDVFKGDFSLLVLRHVISNITPFLSEWEKGSLSITVCRLSGFSIFLRQPISFKVFLQPVRRTENFIEVLHRRRFLSGVHL